MAICYRDIYLFNWGRQINQSLVSIQKRVFISIISVSHRSCVWLPGRLKENFHLHTQILFKQMSLHVTDKFLYDAEQSEDLLYLTLQFLSGFWKERGWFGQFIKDFKRTGSWFFTTKWYIYPQFCTSHKIWSRHSLQKCTEINCNSSGNENVKCIPWCVGKFSFC